MNVSPINLNFSPLTPSAIFFELLGVRHFIFFQVSALIIVKSDRVYLKFYFL